MRTYEKWFKSWTPMTKGDCIVVHNGNGRVIEQWHVTRVQNDDQRKGRLRCMAKVTRYE